MITRDDLTPGQLKYVNLLELTEPEIYASGVVSNRQLKEIHNKLVARRAEDERYKVSWPLWLILNNNIGRGLYQIPKNQESEEEETSPYFEEYQAELKQFGVI